LNPSEALRQCINDLHQLQVAMPDAQHVQLIHQAMAPLLKIQAELAQSSQSQADPRAQVLQQLNG
jgi:hypothetical protein